MSDQPGEPGLGARMKAAAKAAGLSAGEIARRLGVTPSGVYRWWRGEREPSASDLHRYAALCGVDAGALLGEPAARELVALFVRVADRLMAGRPLGAVLREEAGNGLTPEEAGLLDEHSEQFRRLLGDWGRLSDEQRLQVVEQVRRLASGGE